MKKNVITKRAFAAAIAAMAIAMSSMAAIPGDLNGDGNVNAGDISDLYTAILTGSSDNAFDINSDGNINAGDVSTLYSYILNPPIIDNDAELFNACYETLRSSTNLYDLTLTNFVRQIFNLNELPTDEAICNWLDDGLTQLVTNSWGSDLPQATGLWLRLCDNVNICNSYLRNADRHDAQHNAEVTFLRALYLYHMMDLFGNIPLPYDLNANFMTEAQQYPRQTAFDFITGDLLRIQADLAAPRSNDYGRVDQAAAWLLLARLYLNSAVYTGVPAYNEAKQWATKVIDSDYKLLTTSSSEFTPYQSLFLADNDRNGAQNEIILPIIHNGAADVSENYWAYSGTTFIIAATFSPKMNEVYPSGLPQNTWEGIRARSSFVPRLTSKSGELLPDDFISGDNRAMFFAKGQNMANTRIDNWTDGYAYPKFRNINSDNSATSSSAFSDVDFPLMRVAEAYLTYAEADAYLNGGECTDDGLEKFNAVRMRANATPYRGAELGTISGEWSREFGFEGRRRSDMIRFNQFGGDYDYSYNWPWRGGTLEGRDFDASKNIYAIPQLALELNPNLRQNPGYDVDFGSISLTSTSGNNFDASAGQPLQLSVSPVNTDGYIAYPVNNIQISLTPDFTTEVSYLSNYSDGNYYNIVTTDSNSPVITASKLIEVISWYERTNGGSLGDDHDIYLRAVAEANGIGTAVSNVLRVHMAGINIETKPWWLIGTAIANGSMKMPEMPVGSQSMAPMYRYGEPGQLHYAAYFKAGSTFVILPPESPTSYKTAIYGGNENGGQSYGSPEGFITINSDGYYEITLDEITKSLTWTKLTAPAIYSSISVPGWHNSWAFTDVMDKLDTYGECHNWQISLELNTSPYEFKFAADNDWLVNWGAYNYPNGEGYFNGPNIPGAEGTHYIYFNDILGAYTVLDLKDFVQ